jgi:hypothetical protein
MCQADFLLKFLILELSTATDLADKAGKARIFQNSPLPAPLAGQIPPPLATSNSPTSLSD